MHHNYRTRMLAAAMATAILFGLGLMAAWWSDGPGAQAPRPKNVEITTLASAAPGVVYRQSLAGPMHGKPGALYFLAAGRLPRGVQITPSGVVQGQPGAASGSYDFSVGMVEQPAGLSGWQLNRAKARSSRYWFRLPVVDGHD